MKKTTRDVTKELSPSLPYHHSILTLTCRRFFLLITSSLRIDGNAVVSSPTLEHALHIAALTLSPFGVQWTIASRATMPSASPRPPLLLLPSTPSNGATILEIGIIFSNSGCRAPSSISPSPKSSHRRSSKVKRRCRDIPQAIVDDQALPTSSVRGDAAVCHRCWR
uniref:Uncharacterized protein n=1 Tax=Oryza rufipogon TaxID=4529 RepID=A0A0E0NY72_ORYRU